MPSLCPRDKYLSTASRYKTESKHVKRIPGAPKHEAQSLGSGEAEAGNFQEPGRAFLAVDHRIHPGMGKPEEGDEGFSQRQRKPPE